ncbi:MAG: glutamine-hydrolyzing carbamoyl-phosphate synthase small subunit, partial [Bacteroidia bacterium]|nr:glutamine-hydrolyzing carbamoyl-phosphate synthase small subunit [Bacteroidia bacterium]
MKYQTRKKALILLADGTIFYGKAVGGKEGSAFGEVCFNTGMTGYQEIFTDPSYFGQLMVTTNAHIGNYGTTSEEVESEAVKIAGLICRNFSYHHSRPLADASLEEFMEKNNLLAISDVDTRALVNYIREHGAMNAVITTKVDEIDLLKKQLGEVPEMKGLELASRVSTKETYYYGNEKATYRISALDIGIKKNILRNLAARDCYIKVFPYNSSFAEMEAFDPHGYFISNGPGDPEPLTQAIQTTRDILETGMPLFGICLGHQVLALANGISTYKMHNGHRGINHPIKNLLTGKGEITSQNHGFAISREDT